MSRTIRRFGTKAHRRARIHEWISRHHKRCRSNGGNSFEGRESNISIVSQKDHDHWHAMFANHLPPQICEIINKVWLDPRWEFVCVERKDKYDSEIQRPSEVRQVQEYVSECLA